MAEAFAFTCLGKIGDIVLPAIGNYLADPIKRQFNYMCCFDSNITELQTQFQVLETTRRDVQTGADDDRRNARVVEPAVEAWLTRASTVTTEVEEIIQDKAKVEEGCLSGWCPNLKLRYSLSRKAVKKTKIVLDLEAAGVWCTRPCHNPPPRPCHNPPPASLETITSRDFMGFESRKLKMEEIFKALKHDEINLIGVCGMGGVGKTTLVKEVAKRAKEDNDEIAFAVVGQQPNLPDVQASIASMLGLKTLRDEASPKVRADLLRRRLQQDNKKVLVVLDDVWEEFDLQAMGIPLNGANKNLKTLYTSRTRDLWYDVPTKQEIPLELLSEDEAWQLFREKVGDSADARNLQPIARKIVNECGRLPLALVLIGNALSKTTGRNATKEMWEDILYQLTSPSGTPTDQHLYTRLQLSYDCLENEEAKSLFLLCCLFEEDEDISLEDLARYGLGLSLFGGINDLEKVRNQVFLIVDDLKSRYLLLDGASYEVRDCVKVHEIMRDMGISIAAKTKFALVSHGAISQWPNTATYEHCTAISVISNEIEELPEGLTYPKLELLMLRCRKLKKLPPNFFEGMEKLKVLELHDFGGVLTLQSLRNLTTLSLEGFCGSLDNVSLKGGLLNLEILNLHDSNIEELPQGIGELANLRVLDLTDTRSLTRIPSCVISRLVHLEELSFWGSDYIWRNVSCEGEEGLEEEGRNANLGELELLSNLNILEIVIDGNVVIPEVPIFSKLKQYKVVIGALWEIENMVEVDFFRKCKRVLSVKSSILIPPNRGGIGSLLRSGDCLVLEGEGCNDLVQALLLRDGVDGLQQLKYLIITRCDTPECLASTMNQVHLPAVFPILKAIYLRELDKLREICRGPVAARSFGELTSIDVYGCKRMENLFQQPIVGCLTQLKHLIICHCDLMEQVILKENQEDIHVATNKSIVFPKLEVLKLKELPSLVGFCRGVEQIDFPQLKELYLHDIPQVNFLFRDDGSLYSDSEQNNNVGSFSIFSQKVLSPNLEVLVVSDCLKMEVVIDKQEEREGTEIDETQLSSLVKLELHRLPNLRSFCSLSDPLEMPLLSKMHILDCPNMYAVSFGYVRAPILPLEGISWDNDVKKARQALEQIGIPCLEDLEVSGLENGSDLSSSEPLTSSLYKLLTVRQCSKLLCGFPSHLLFRLQRLQKLKVESCESLEVIFEVEGLQSNGPNPEIFFSLKSVKLCYLPKLNYISKRGLIGLKNIQILEICECNSLTYVFAPIMTKSIPQLCELKISGCEILSRIVAAENGLGGITVDEVEFPRLEKLELHNLPKLLSFFPNVNVNSNSMAKSTDHCDNSPQRQPLFNKKVAIPRLENLELTGLENVSDLWCTELSTSSFSKLKQLEVSSCTSLRNMFHPSMAKGLVNLEKLFIKNCSTLEAVVGNEGQVGDFIEVGNVDNTLFPQLANLGLNSLPNLMRFCHFTYPLKMPLVTKIDIFDCPNMDAFSGGPLNRDPSHAKPVAQEDSFPKLEVLQVKMLKNLERLGHGPLSVGPFSKLKELSLCNCSKLVCVFPSQLLSMLQELEKLTVKRCDSLEVVLEVEGVDSNEPNPQVLSLLKFVKLRHLPKLKHISKRDPEGFRSLQTLEIHDCHSLTCVFSPMTKSIPQLRKLKISKCEMLSRIVIEENEQGRSSVDEVEFPQLKSLELLDLPNLFSFFPNGDVNTTTLEKPTDSCNNNNPQQPLPLFNEKVVVSSLEYLGLSGLKNVTDIWGGEFLTSSFSTLKHLEISKCISLINIFCPSTVIVPQQNVRPISGLTQRVAAFFRHQKIVKLFPQLGKLQLISLPKLQRFSDFTCPTEMPLLSEVDILSCPELEKLSVKPVSTPSFSLLGTPLDVDPNNPEPILQQLFDRLLVGTKAVGETWAREAQPHEEALSSSLKVVLENVPEDEDEGVPLVRRDRGRGQGQGLGYVKAYSQEEAGPSNQAAVMEDVPQDLGLLKSNHIHDGVKFSTLSESMASGEAPPSSSRETASIDNSTQLQNLGSSERDFEQLRKAIVMLKQVNAALSDHYKVMYDDLLLVDSAFVDTKEYMDHMSKKISQACSKFKDLISNVSPEEERDFHDLRKDIKKLKVQIPSHVKIRSADSNRHPYQWPNINHAADDKMTQFFYKDVRDPGDTCNGNSDGLWKDFSALPQILRICLLCFFKFPPEAIIKRTAMIYMWMGLGYTNFFLIGHLIGQDNENYANEIFDYLVDNAFIESIYQTCSLVPDGCRMSLRVRAALYHEARYLGFTSDDNLQLDLGFFWGQSCLVNVGQANLNWELEVSSNEARNDERSLSEPPTNVSLPHSLKENARHIRNLYFGRWQGSTTPKGPTHHIELTDTDAKVLDGLKYMEFLTFLSLRGISMITELPTSMVKLKCLEILDLRACHNLEAIPENIGILENLTHLDMSECYFLEHMPESLSQLSNLEVLKGFVLGDEENKQSCTLLHLSRLQKLRKLNIYVSVKNFEGRCDFDHLKSFHAVQKLTISWGGCSFPGKETGAEALCTKGKLELPKKLQKLDIRCFPAAHLADWFKPATIEGLKKLYIQGGQLCRIRQAQECQWEQWNVEILRLKYLYESDIDWSELRILFPKLIYLMYKAEDPDPELPRLPPNKEDVWKKLDAGCPEFKDVWKKFAKFQCNEAGTVWMSKEALRSDKQLQKLQKYLLNSGMISSSSVSGLIQS